MSAAAALYVTASKGGVRRLSCTAGSSSGRTGDFDSPDRGSTPLPAANPPFTGSVTSREAAPLNLDVVAGRLSNHRLGPEKCASPAEVVAHLGAVQAQDYSAAKWSVGLRMQDAMDADVERAFNAGAILRTHVMRPTWHFVTPEDIRPLLALTAPRVQAGRAGGYRELGLDTATLAKCRRVIARALVDEHHLTRAEVADRLGRHGVKGDGRRLAYILMHAELEGLICSGPRRGKQFTYALLDERAPARGPFDRDRMLADWTLRYFRGHGPAQVVDFAWWAGLTARDAQQGLEMMQERLASETVGGKTYWFVPLGRPPRPDSSRALLLSLFDEYVIAYRDRGDLAEDRYLETLLSSGAAVTSVLVIDGRISGTWKRSSAPGRPLKVTLRPFRRLGSDERAVLQDAVAAYAAFLGVADGGPEAGHQSQARRRRQSLRPK